MFNNFFPEVVPFMR